MYCGLWRALQEHLHLVQGTRYAEFLLGIRGFAGTSVGALAALCMLLRLSSTQVTDVFGEGMRQMRSLAPRPDISMLLERHGLDDGAALRACVVAVLEAGGLSGSATFADVRRLLQRDFVCVSTNVLTQQPTYYSPLETPDVHVADAVYASMCVPLLFVPTTHGGDLQVDGGLTHNMPRVFPPEETLHIAFVHPTCREPICNLADYILALSHMVGDSSLWYERHECLRLTLPREAYERGGLNLGVLPCVQEARTRCGYASGLAYLYPGLHEAIRLLIRLLCAAAQRGGETLTATGEPAARREAGGPAAP